MAKILPFKAVRPKRSVANLLASRPFYTYKKHLLEIRYQYLKKGEEALYSEFNTDYLNYDISEGYNEAFPFGEINEMSGILFSYYWVNHENLHINSNISYWINSYLGSEGINYSLSFQYFFDFKNKI